MNSFAQYLRPDLIWFAIAIILFLAELFAPAMFSLFFGVGALAVSVICMVIDIPLTAQLLIFLIVSIFSLVVLRRWFRQVFTGGIHDVDRGITEFTGQKVLVLEPITRARPGRVELNGTPWSAEAETAMNPGEYAEVIERNGLVLKVKPIERSS